MFPSATHKWTRAKPIDNREECIEMAQKVTMTLEAGLQLPASKLSTTLYHKPQDHCEGTRLRVQHI